MLATFSRLHPDVVRHGIGLVDGDVGVAPSGKLLMVLKFIEADGKIVEIEAIADRDRLRQIDLAVLDEGD